MLAQPRVLGVRLDLVVGWQLADDLDAAADADLRTAYIGSLRATTIPYFTSPVAGLPMVHWNESH